MTSPDVRIRVASPDDAAALLKIYAPYVEQTSITFAYDVPTVEEFRDTMQTVLRRYPYLVAERGDSLLGYVYAQPFKSRTAYDWAVETSIYVDGDKKRMGLGRRLYEALEHCLKKMGIQNLNACIAYPSAGGDLLTQADERLTTDSVAFHYRMGYEWVGRFHLCAYKFERWYDMIWMEKWIGSHPSGPKPVIPFEPKMFDWFEAASV